ncbi:MAG: RNA polymerase sigma factor RpoE [Limnobacter sp.]|jgi:RNA polymerase sigma-70 factor (ECF subfamily)|uniref:RNA polymerase sigma factor n=1 Tax=Limnobacter profundi TaxID=2732163 RepID=A0ABX6N568_9BURK|nr:MULTISPECIES: RNA polymerase sigma factor RpoE [Limnobacter]MAG80328.1 RNA polymerase sigma factor RpoE [Sutterellaceae bacterium]MBA4314643.1 RNA polymerase sigma factor RpoE [Alcaligenaceae bacterium]PZO14694.1 MAG: RNA polymerase sigma factor RpoE [Betaproteobacteria bacterium]EDM84031.1 RNA polymerase, sigma-24 subunit, ECF subfamily protein [Limnobacter sp. MED105]MAZ08869.1 RNA polymerase sigma factor RpoE [Sutterellaceae bacterium]
MSSDKDDDLLIVQRVQAGDKLAFNLLVNKYHRRVARLLTRMVRNQEDIEDVVQETFIKAYRAIGNFRGDSAFYTWIYRIAINTAKNLLVTQGRRPSTLKESNDGDSETFEDNAALSNIDTPESLYQTKQIGEAVNEAMAALPEELRSAIVMREIDGLSYEEIAAAMDCPIGTVRSRIFRARESIAAKIKPLLEPKGSKRW